MAFGFFRRRQKMVILIMVILMVSFLVGYQGFELLFQPNQDPPIGRMGDQEIRQRQLQQAQQDVETLTRLTAEYPVRELDAFFSLRRANPEGDVTLAYALLLAEANKANVRSNDSDLNFLLNSICAKGEFENQDAFFQAMRSRRGEPLGKQQIKQALSNWAAIAKNFHANKPTTPPSKAELQRVYRDTQEKIAVRVVRVKAEDFLSKVQVDPPPQELTTFFQQYMNRFEGQTQGNVGDTGESSREASFGFGYRQPDKVSIQYLLLREQALLRGSRPSEQAVRDHFMNNQEYRRLNKKLSEVRDEIVQTLEQGEIKARTDAVFAEAEKIAAEYAAKGGPGNVYEKVKADMVLPADSLLNKTLKDVMLEGTLAQAVEQLAQKAELSAIVFPYGLEGEVSIDPQVRVLLNEKQITLGQALQKLTDKVLGPQSASKPAKASAAIEWRTCKGFDGVLFPVGPSNLDLFPLEAGQTGLKTAAEIQSDQVIGRATSAAKRSGTPLLNAAFLSKALVDDYDRRLKGLDKNAPNVEDDRKLLEAQKAQMTNQGPSSVAVGQSGPRMFANIISIESYFRPPTQPNLLWRIVEVKSSYVPSVDEFSKSFELRAKATRDWKLRKAYDLALAAAKELVKSAAVTNLETAVKQENQKAAQRKDLLTLESKVTQPFARKDLEFPRDQIEMNLMRDVAPQVGIDWRTAGMEDYRKLQAIVRSNFGGPLMQQPHLRIGFGDPGIELGNAALTRQQFIDAAFALAPAKVDPPYADKPPVGTAELRLLREVAVLERAEFIPAVASDFQQSDMVPMSASWLALQISAQVGWEFENSWFHMGKEGADFGIAARTGFHRDVEQ